MTALTAGIPQSGTNRVLTEFNEESASSASGSKNLLTIRMPAGYKKHKYKCKLLPLHFKA
jgi:hypothetical protein